MTDQLAVVVVQLELLVVAPGMVAQKSVEVAPLVEQVAHMAAELEVQLAADRLVAVEQVADKLAALGQVVHMLAALVAPKKQQYLR